VETLTDATLYAGARCDTKRSKFTRLGKVNKKQEWGLKNCKNSVANVLL